MIKTPRYDSEVAECYSKASRRTLLEQEALRWFYLSMDKDGPDSETDMSLLRKIGDFAVQHLNYGHVRFSASSMCWGSEGATVDVDAGLVSEKCLHNLEIAPEDCDS
jgi:hypothetical protein